MSLEIIGAGAVFIDDIVLPDGRTHMGRLGGGVVHALMGAALWDTRPGIIAITGDGLPKEAAHFLQRHLDTTGLTPISAPQIRAWQIFEFDGTRRELYRTPVSEPFIRGAQPEHLPPAFQDAPGLYLLQDFDGVRRWRDCCDKIILWEPSQLIMQPANRAAFRQTLRAVTVDIVSPNLAEAQAIYGPLSPSQLVDALLEDGARIAALRLGPEGSLIGDQNGQRCAVRAFPVAHIADQTGAGNTYCGAFLCGIVQGAALSAAGAMAAVAASYCLETIGILDPDAVSRAERDQRVHTLINEDLTA